MQSTLFNTRHVISALLAPLLLLLGSGVSLAADATNGGEIYAKHCAACHGKTGNSVMPNAPNLALGERMMQPDSALLTFIKTGKQAMPGYQGILKENDILDVIAFTRTLRQH